MGICRFFNASIQSWHDSAVYGAWPSISTLPGSVVNVDNLNIGNVIDIAPYMSLAADQNQASSSTLSMPLHCTSQSTSGEKDGSYEIRKENTSNVRRQN